MDVYIVYTYKSYSQTVVHVENARLHSIRSTQVIEDRMIWIVLNISVKLHANDGSTYLIVSQSYVLYISYSPDGITQYIDKIVYWDEKNSEKVYFLRGQLS